jgi:hypothetical protein
MAMICRRAKQAAEKLTHSERQQIVDVIGGPTNALCDFFDSLLYSESTPKPANLEKNEFFRSL